MSDWSTFEEDVKANTSSRGPRCGVAVMLDGLEPGNRYAIELVLDDRRFQVPAILKALAGRIENPPSAWSLANHRRGKCGCAR